MKLITDVILLFLPSVNDGVFIFKVAGVDYKLTKSTDTCTSDRVASTIKVSIKEAFMGNEGFLQMFMWSMDFSQKIKDLLHGKFSI